MQILDTVRKILPFFGVFELECTNSAILRIISRTLTLGQLFYSAVWVTRFLLFEPASMDDLSKAITLTNIVVYITSLYITMLLQQSSLLSIFQCLEDEIHHRGYIFWQLATVSSVIFKLLLLFSGQTLTGTDIYQKLNDSMESQVNQIVFIMMVILGPCFVIPPIAETLYGYYVLDLGESAFTLAFPSKWVPCSKRVSARFIRPKWTLINFRLPYNWRTPTRYVLTIVVNLCQYNCNIFIHFAACYLFYGLCKFLMAFTDDFRHSLVRIDETIRERAKLSPKKPFDYNQVKEMLCDTIWLQSNMKQLSGMGRKNPDYGARKSRMERFNAYLSFEENLQICKFFVICFLCSLSKIGWSMCSTVWMAAISPFYLWLSPVVRHTVRCLCCK